MLRVWKSLKYAKKSIYRKTKKKQSEKKTQNKRNFLYKNHQLLLKHCTFIHRYHDFSHGFTHEFELEPLASQAFFQRRALSYRHNHGQCITPSYIPQPAITYQDFSNTNSFLSSKSFQNQTSLDISFIFLISKV